MKRNRRFNLAKLIGGGLILIILLFCYFYFRYQYTISTPVNSANSEIIYLQINKGENVTQISKKLAAKNLILDAGNFSLYARLNSIDLKFKPGRYPLSQTQSTIEIAKILSSNENRQVVLTIPEGLTVYDIDQLLVENGVIQNGEFSAAVKNYQKYSKYDFLNQEKQSTLAHPLEGYLFPDTYFVDPNDFSNEILIDLMLKNFKNKIADLGLSKDPEKSFQTIIVASMIEKESPSGKDRGLVSGIIWKRIEQHWVLGIDATLLYLKKDRTIDYQDLQEDNPYNTRKINGLPPGPISNPGLESIKAAINPTTSDYWYYLTSKDGEMIYARTNEEHNANKSRYL